MATERTQDQSQDPQKGAGNFAGEEESDEELSATMDDGTEVSVELDDSLSASEDGEALEMDSDDDETEGGVGGGLRGGSGNFANDPGRASEAGRKGGRH